MKIFQREELSGVLAKIWDEGFAEGRAEINRRFVSNMLKDGKLAFDTIAKYAEVSIKFVQDMAKSLGIEPR